MTTPEQQALIDATTWIPVAFFTFVDTGVVYVRAGEDYAIPEPPVLHQLWVSALGQTEWRKVETRNLKAMTKAYAECTAFNDNPEENP